MATLPEVVRQNELLNQLVLNRDTMEELGRIEVLWMYPQVHRVLGFICKSGFWGAKRTAFKLSQVEAIGSNGILTHWQPEETDAEHVRQLESLIHCEVWSNAGNKLGKVIDCVFNLRNGVITDYLVVGDRFNQLSGTIYRLPPAKIDSFGRRRILVAETSIQSLATYREGLQQKLSKATSVLKEDYTHATEELRSLAKQAQETTQHTTAQLKTLAEQARERAQLLAEQAKEKAQELNEQLQESAQTLAEQAKETREILVERVQERTETLGEQLKDSAQTITVQAREIFDAAINDESEPLSTQATTQTQKPVQPEQPTQSSMLDDEFWILDDNEDDNESWTSSSDKDQPPENHDDSWDIPEPPELDETDAVPTASTEPAREPSPEASPLPKVIKPITSEDEDDDPWI
ncbi:MAG: hypothetical protein HC866_11820 [Leptolyngbyaceae cyanobacterium RU_5_1]|nr:hypothetical protein [Leptolyngbyaceae cyanobacterium RU_5_1]